MKPMISVAAASGLLEAITAAGGDPDQVKSQDDTRRHVAQSYLKDQKNTLRK